MQYHTKTSGYSLIEVLVAISILLIAIVGPMTIASKGLQNAQFAREQTLATFLAQEGIEIIVGLRGDDGLERVEYLSGTPPINTALNPSWGWKDASLLNFCRFPTGCGLEMTGGGVSDTDCAGSTNCRLYKATVPQQNMYTYDDTAGSATKFTRKIYLEETTSADRVLVRSVVEWEPPGLGTTKTIELQTYLYDIYRYE